jgi:thiamine biosynthesis lipoprotein ApbE
VSGSAGLTTAGPDRLASFAGRALGSSLRLTVRIPEPAPAASLAAATLAWAEILAEFDAVDAALSRFRDDSELTMLNRLAGSGAVVAVSGRTRMALAAIDRARRITDERFDAGVLGALERIGEHGAALDRPAPVRPAPVRPARARSAPVRPAPVRPARARSAPVRPAPVRPARARSAPVRPAPVRPARARSAPVRPAVESAERRFRVTVPPVPVDMGGIGKGLALRWAGERARRLLPDGAGLLLEAGGDIVHRGTPPAEGWRIGIEDPAAAGGDETESIVVVDLRSGAVATSSVAVRNWVGPDGRPVHHLLDPRTGEPARGGLIAVTVAAPDPAWAEVWSKALFLLGRDGIAEDARARGLAAWWVDDRGRLGMTPDARLRTAWAAEDRLG